MKITEELEELRAQLEKQQAEGEVEQEELVEDEIPAVEEPEEVKEVEAPVEDPTPVKEELDDAGYARLRREKAAAEKRAREAEERLAALQTRETQEVVETQIDPAINELIEEVRINKAGREFNNLEAEFSQTTPDYEDVSNAYKAALYQSIRVQNPSMRHEQLLEETNKKLLYKASQYLNRGFNPIEEMYYEAKTLGFKARPKEVEQKEEKVLKHDLSKIAANKARNAGTAAAKGAGDRAELTLAVAAELPAHEWAKLPASEKRRLLNGG